MAENFRRRGMGGRARGRTPGDPLPGRRLARRRDRRGRARGHRGRHRRGAPGLRRRDLAAARRPASAATCCCGSPTCSSATRPGSPGPSPSTPASAWSRASTTSTTSSASSATSATSPAEDAGRVVDTGNPDVVSRIVHEPVGVCGLITPWNYPLLQVSWKVAPVPRGRQHLRAQAERAHPAHRDPPDAAARRGRAARGRRPTSSLGAGPERGRAAQRGPARRPGVVHRRARHRQADHGRRRRHGEEGRARARRQEPQHRLRRRRPRGRRSTWR